MKDLDVLFDRYFTDGLQVAVAGNPVFREDVLPSKVRLRPVRVKGKLLFQMTETVGQKELHRNLSAQEAADVFTGLLRHSAEKAAGEEAVTGAAAGAEATGENTTVGNLVPGLGQQFRQIDILHESATVTILAGRKGKLTIKEKKKALTNGPEGEADRKGEADGIFTHNRTKNYVLPEGEPVPFLVELGVMTKSGTVVKARYDKFRQINRYLEFVEDIIPALPSGRQLSIIDFGCGKSYLTFALYYYLHEKKGFDVRITGLDLKKDVIEHCNALAEQFGYKGLKFLHGDIADYTGTDSVDMVVTLHACDTATDYALYKAVSWNAGVIMCVPCCQHELNRQIKKSALEPVLKYGLIKERMAALMTDALRADILEEKGYSVQVLEFIDMEHTPKNILIRAVKSAKRMLPKGADRSRDYRAVMDEFGVEPTLARLFEDEQGRK